MSEVLKANVFFFITGVSAIVFTVLLCVALYHVIKALRTLRRILDRVEEGTEVIADDLGQVRAYFTEEGLIPRLLSTLMGSPRKTARKQKPPKSGRGRTELPVTEE